MEEDETGCRICYHPVLFIYELWDDRYGYPGRFPAVRCEHCGHIAVQVRMTAQEINSLYTKYYPRSNFDIETWVPPSEQVSLVSWWLGLNASAFRWVPRNVRVLDIGCGLGTSLGYHRNRGCDAHGVEADANIVRIAERHGLNIHVGLFDPDLYEPASFDVVTMDQVIEHTLDPVAVLRGVESVLKPGGKLILSTPNASGWGMRAFGKRWTHWHVPYHNQFFSRMSMGIAANAAGLAVESVRTVTNSAWLGLQCCHLVALPKEGCASSFWNVKLPRRVGQRCGFAIMALANKVGINAALTRVFDTLGLGDNYLFMLRKPVIQPQDSFSIGEQG